MVRQARIRIIPILDTLMQPATRSWPHTKKFHFASRRYLLAARAVCLVAVAQPPSSAPHLRPCCDFIEPGTINLSPAAQPSLSLSPAPTGQQFTPCRPRKKKLRSDSGRSGAPHLPTQPGDVCDSPRIAAAMTAPAIAESGAGSAKSAIGFELPLEQRRDLRRGLPQIEWL